MGKAKLVGLLVDRKEVGGPGEFADLENMTADELRQHVQELVRSLDAAEGVGDTAAIAEGAGKGTASRQASLNSEACSKPHPFSRMSRPAGDERRPSSNFLTPPRQLANDAELTCALVSAQIFRIRSTR